jgi:outer membrane protein assembly factor BamB
MAVHKYFSTIAATLLGMSLVWAVDWPQFLGPNRDGSSPEKGLLTTWPAAGPKVLWKVDGGIGYSGIAVAGGKAITLVSRGGDELVLALDIASGKELWKTKSGPTFVEDQGSGPRSTPTIDGKRVYVQSASGPLLCLEADSGKIVWQVDLLKEFAAKNITWGLCASPLIVGDLVLAEPGGKGAGVAAFKKETGKPAWKLGDDGAAYASPVSVNVGGKPQVIFFTATGLLAVEPSAGKELWRVPWHTEYDCNIATPLPVGDQLFVSSGEKVGCALFKLGAAKPSTVWESKGAGSVMITYWANAVVQDKHLYGIAGEYNIKYPDLRCVNLSDGKQAWTQSKFGKANLTLADGHLFIATVDGDLVLAAATPKEYQEKARVKKLLNNDRFSTAPTIADKKLYLRDSKSIMCLDIAGK